MSKLLSQGGFGCVYYPGITCNGKTDKEKKYVTKLQRKDFNANNEIYIGQLVSSIKNFNNFFIPVIKSCDIDLRRIDTNIISDCQVITQSSEVNYLLMTLNYVKNISLEKTIVTSSSKEIKKRSFAQLLSMYMYLLNSIKLLYEKNIIHFDLKIENLLFWRFCVKKHRKRLKLNLFRKTLALHFKISIICARSNGKHIYFCCVD